MLTVTLFLNFTDQFDETPVLGVAEQLTNSMYAYKEGTVKGLHVILIGNR